MEQISRRNANPSVATAKKAISEYTKAVGNPLGILELRVFWCETAVGFSIEYGFSDAGYLEALLRQYRDACQVLLDIAEPQLMQQSGADNESSSCPDFIQKIRVTIQHLEQLHQCQ